MLARRRLTHTAFIYRCKTTVAPGLGGAERSIGTTLSNFEAYLLTRRAVGRAPPGVAAIQELVDIPQWYIDRFRILQPKFNAHGFLLQPAYYPRTPLRHMMGGNPLVPLADIVGPCTGSTLFESGGICSQHEKETRNSDLLDDFQSLPLRIPWTGFPISLLLHASVIQRRRRRLERHRKGCNGRGIQPPDQSRQRWPTPWNQYRSQQVQFSYDKIILSFASIILRGAYGRCPITGFGDIRRSYI